MSVRKSTEEKIAEHKQAELEKRFGSVVQLSVKVLRPMDTYPYEREVWSSEIRVPITESRQHVESVTAAWVKTMESGVELAKSFADMKEEKSD